MINFNSLSVFDADCNQYTWDHKHEGCADGLERRRRGAAFVSTEGGLVRAQGNGAGRRIHTQEVTGRGHHRACPRQGISRANEPRLVARYRSKRQSRYLHNNHNNRQ